MKKIARILTAAVAVAGSVMGLAPAAQVPPRALPQLTLNVSHFVIFGSVMPGVNAPPAKVLISVSNKTSNIITGTAIAIPQ